MGNVSDRKVKVINETHAFSVAQFEPLLSLFSPSVS